MSCGCNNNGSGGSDQPAVNLTANLTPAYQTPLPGDCESTSGKFYDRMTDSFVVPQVGKESYIFVCEAARWMIGQYVAVDLGANNIAAFKITGRTNKKLKVLNGCDRSGNNPILGNPEPGTVIPVNSTIYAIAPYGCASGDAQRIIRILETQGVDAILNILQESTAVCFNNVPPVSEEEEVHLFGGTQPDCDCAPQGFISSCLRKALKIFTGQAGRTLCMPEAAVVDQSVEPGIVKRLAFFVNGCLKMGPTPEEFDDCGNFSPVADGASFENFIVCDGGDRKIIKPTEEGQVIESVKEVIEGEDVFKWKIGSGRDCAIIVHSTAEKSGGTATAGAWRDRTLNSIAKNIGDLVDLTNNEITIKKPGKYLVSWGCVFYGVAGCQSRLFDTENSEAFIGTTVYSDSKSTGNAVIEVSTTKKIKLQYYVANTGANGQGYSNEALSGSHVWASLSITKL